MEWIAKVGSCFFGNIDKRNGAAKKRHGINKIISRGRDECLKQ